MCKCEADFWIFEHIQIFNDGYNHVPKYLLDFRATQLIKHYLLIFFLKFVNCKYLNIFEYL